MKMTREEFLLRRKQGIGGSDIAAIAGLSPWRSPLDVFYDKLGIEFGNTPVENFPVGEKSACYWGSVHEAAIGKAYTLVTGRNIRRYNRLIVHSEKDFFIGDVDFLAHCQDGSRPFKPNGEIVTDKGIECKFVRYRDDKWGEQNTDEIPIWYVCQTQWYMGMVESLESFDLPVLFSGCDFSIFTVKKSQEIIGRLQEIGERFWVDHVKKQVPPPPRSMEEVKRLYRDTNVGKTKLASVELENAVKELQQVSAERLKMEKRECSLKDYISCEMQDAESLILPDDTVIATFKNERNSRVLRVKKQK